MSAGTRTFGLDETFIEPRVLPPPPTRHALFVFLIALASILHLCTAGWSDIHNGAEGYYAGAARQLFEQPATAADSPRECSLLTWMMLASFKIFGVSAAAARLPIAAAMVASIVLTFLIGERIAGYWRGFVAGLLHLCCLGSFIWGRIITPAPLFAALLEGAIFCAFCGYQGQRSRRLWFAGVWLCAALACMTQGLEGLLLPALIFCVLAFFYREARMRFRQLLHWSYFLIFLALIIPWHFWIQGANWAWLIPFRADHPSPGEGLARFALDHALWWFPALLLVLPGVCFAARRIFRPREFEFGDALPVIWMAAGFLPLLFIPQRQDWDSMPMWGAFALWAAFAWDRSPRAFRLAGLGLVAIAGMVFMFSSQFPLSRTLPVSGSMLFLIGVTVASSALLAAYFAWRERETLAIALVMLGMVPVGLSAAESMARMGPDFSLARAAHFLQPRLGEAGEVLYEGPAFAASSLTFYLETPFFIAGDQGLNEETAMEKFSAAHPVYLIMHKDRVPYWQERLTERFHLYHQETTCGAHVVVSNQP